MVFSVSELHQFMRLHNYQKLTKMHMKWKNIIFEDSVTNKFRLDLESPCTDSLNCLKPTETVRTFMSWFASFLSHNLQQTTLLIMLIHSETNQESFGLYKRVNQNKLSKLGPDIWHWMEVTLNISFTNPRHLFFIESWKNLILFVWNITITYITANILGQIKGSNSLLLYSISSIKLPLIIWTLIFHLVSLRD